MKVIILTAGDTDKFSGNKLKLPHGLLEINGIPLIYYTLYNCLKCAIPEVIIVTGFKKNKIISKIGSSFDSVNIRYVENQNFSTTTTATSILKTKNLIDEDVVIVDGDILFSNNGFRDVLKTYNNDIILSTSLSGNGIEACIYHIDNKIEALILREEFSHLRFNFPIEINNKKITGINLREDPGIRKLSYKTYTSLLSLIYKDIENKNSINKLEHYINKLLIEIDFHALKVPGFKHYKTRPDVTYMDQLNSIYTKKELIEINSLLND